MDHPTNISNDALENESDLVRDPLLIKEDIDRNHLRHATEKTGTKTSEGEGKPRIERTRGIYL